MVDNLMSWIHINHKYEYMSHGFSYIRMWPFRHFINEGRISVEFPVCLMGNASLGAMLMGHPQNLLIFWPPFCSHFELPPFNLTSYTFEATPSSPQSGSHISFLQWIFLIFCSIWLACLYMWYHWMQCFRLFWGARWCIAYQTLVGLT